MKRLVTYSLLLLMAISSMAQTKDSLKFLDNDSLFIQQQNDSLQWIEIRKQLEASKTNEHLLAMEIEKLRYEKLALDSLKVAKIKLRIDSLRSVTTPVPLIVENDTIYYIYTNRGGVLASNRAEIYSANILKLGKSITVKPDSVYLVSTENTTDILYNHKVVATVTDMDGFWENTTHPELAEKHRKAIIKELYVLQKEHGLVQLIKQGVLFLLIIIFQLLLFRLTRWLYLKIKQRILIHRKSKLKPIAIQNYELLSTEVQTRILVFFANMARYLLILIQLIFSVPMLFSIFPKTEDYARTTLNYILNPILSIAEGVVAYIPNLFIILVIYFSIHYLIKGLKYFASEIAEEKLKIPGFYADWAYPTFHIIRFLLYAFMLAMIYPYLPGANSQVFQGVSVFVGIIFSLGSSTVIGNIIAGLVITYMRPFRLGDFIKLNDTTGNVVEKTPFVTRIRTPKNELVTIPNSFIMSSHTTNYSSSAQQFGLIIHSEVTIGYDAPWRKVHQLLIDAAQATPGVLESPEPFVLETSLSDYYPVYQVNAYISSADGLAKIYSQLHQNIQDKFNAAGVEIMSPSFTAYRDGSESTIPKSNT